MKRRPDDESESLPPRRDDDDKDSSWTPSHPLRKDLPEQQRPPTGGDDWEDEIDE